jgi:hypothetical protein
MLLKTRSVCSGRTDTSRQSTALSLPDINTGVSNTLATL